MNQGVKENAEIVIELLKDMPKTQEAFLKGDYFAFAIDLTIDEEYIGRGVIIDFTDSNYPMTDDVFKSKRKYLMWEFEKYGIFTRHGV